jgi:predicted anti-sigma-YlaC factor YlaD
MASILQVFVAWGIVKEGFRHSTPTGDMNEVAIGFTITWVIMLGVMLHSSIACS